MCKKEGGIQYIAEKQRDAGKMNYQESVTFPTSILMHYKHFLWDIFDVLIFLISVWSPAIRRQLHTFMIYGTRGTVRGAEETREFPTASCICK